MPNVEIIWDDVRIERQRPRTPWTVADLPLFGLLTIGAVWTLVSAGLSIGDAAPVGLLFVGIGLVFGTARLLTFLSPSFVPIVVVASAGWLLGTSPDVLDRFPFSGPFGYTNATGAFYAQAAIAALMLAMTWRRPWTRIAAVLAAIGLAWVPLAIDSRAPVLLLMTVPLVALTVKAIYGPRAAVVACAALFALALWMTGVLAGLYSGRDAPADRFIEATVTERRVLLWHQALVIAAQHPVNGVGPGRFNDVSPLAQANRDTTRWAHNGFLQQGAEAGIPGFVILLLLFVYGFTRLSAVASTNPNAVWGAVALAVLGINASVDYILHFGAIPIVTAAVVAAATIEPEQTMGEP